MSVKKRKLDENRRGDFDKAIDRLKRHLVHMETRLDDDDDATEANVSSEQVARLEQTQMEHKADLDQVLKCGHVLIEQLDNGQYSASNVATFRFLLLIAVK